MKPLSFSAEQDIFQNEFLRLYSVRAQFENFTKEYFVTEKGVRVGILLLRDDHILLVRQYRFLINDYSWEIPGGGVQPDESLEQAAIRECREETGIECYSLDPLFNYLAGTDVTDNRIQLFTTTAFSETRVTGDGKEVNAQKWVTVEECMRRILSGKIKDLMTIVTLLISSQKGIV